MTCLRGDVLLSPPSLLLVIRWTKTVQTVGNAPVIPIPRVQEHPADPTQAYLDLLAASPITHPNQPLLAITSGSNRTVVTILMLVTASTILLYRLFSSTPSSTPCIVFNGVGRGGGGHGSLLGWHGLDRHEKAQTVGVSCFLSVVVDQSAISRQQVGDNQYKLEGSAKTCHRMVSDLGGDLCVMVGDSCTISADLLPTDCGPLVVQPVLE